MQSMNKKVAVVEDNPDSMVLIHALLRGRYNIVAYRNSYEALDNLREEQPDIILMDISMPVLGGIELLHMLREEDSTKNIPVIALTAHAMKGDREKYISLGFDDYLTKPIFDKNKLYEAIKSILPG